MLIEKMHPDHGEMVTFENFSTIHLYQYLGTCVYLSSVGRISRVHPPFTKSRSRSFKFKSSNNDIERPHVHQDFNFLHAD